ncbi:hypothetical protein IE53DRAFT_404803 [Violaceomyces palustris]|uniref:Uncharacterized protein n=1 Tax=Violaceomyces palustris TaxID=1673888 RepID=A0ACD0P506_9BASI|nr:hypothetical protein IE53DRAFT_404803 [Violaceomyces palustris]
MSAFIYPLASTSTAPLSFKGSTLILPVVSVGSAPQLAVDLIINSKDLGLRKVARIDPNYCLPFIGPSERIQASGSQDENDVCTALEVFQNLDALTVVQQRSPVIKSQEAQFVSELLAWIRDSEFKEVLVLSSIDAAARTDAEFETPLLHLTPIGQPSRVNSLSERLSKSFPAFEARPPPSHLVPRSFSSADEKQTIPLIPGGGLTRKILRAASSSGLEADTGAVLLFCGEGDNRGDGHALAKVACTLVGSQPKGEFEEPPSWSSLFGQPIDQSMFG